MTADEFNEKYKDYLEGGFYGLDIDHPDVVNYLDQEFKELINVFGFRYSQIKLKFGYSRFYCDKIDTKKVSEIENKIDEIIRQ